jgi:hypothetical protein
MANPPDQEIWSKEGLQQDEFYAAAYYMSNDPDLRQRKETLAKCPLLHQGPNIPHAETFLDCLALLFARYKTRRASEHVAATAMVQQPDGLQVYISKNNGPETVERGPLRERKDEDFARKLSAWLNDDTFASKPVPGSDP